MSETLFRELTSGLIAMGAIVMSYSAWRTGHIISLQLNKKRRALWSALRGLMGAFLLGYVGAFFLILHNAHKPLQALTSLVFFAGAIFVLMIVLASRGSMRELKKKAAELDGEKMFSENVILSVAEAIFVVTPTGTMSTANNAAVALLGYDQTEMMGSLFGMVIQEKEQEAAFAGERLVQLVQSGGVQDLKMTFRAKSGEIIPASVNGSAMQGEQGELIAIVLVCRDMRETHKLLAAIEAAAAADRKKAEELQALNEQLREAQSQLIQTSKLSALGNMATGMAHEINQPLSYIDALIRSVEVAIKMGKIEKAGLEQLVEDGPAQVQRITSVIDHVRMFARADDTDKEPVNLRDICNDAFSLTSERIRLAGVKLSKSYPQWEPMVSGNRYQLEQVILNLIQNALDAASGKWDAPKEISLTIDGSPTVVELAVYNTGPPIAADAAEHLFEPFFTTKEVGKGTGMGLSISHGIIKDHGGTITYEPRSGGVVFKVVLNAGAVDVGP